MPAWLLTIVSAFAFVGLFGGAFFAFQYFKKEKTAPGIQLENPPAANTPGAKRNPLEKLISASGIRFVQNAAKKTEVRFVVVNHSAAQLPELNGKLILTARTDTGQIETLDQIDIKIPSLGPFESKDMSEKMNTHLQAYELPDWQLMAARIEL